MNKYQEALGKLRKIEQTENTWDENCEVLQELADKATPKKPDFWGDGYGDEYWNCPCCGASFETDYDKYDYCPECGQAIDWSVEDDPEI